MKVTLRRKHTLQRGSFPPGGNRQHRVPREAVEEMKCVQEGQENQDRQRPRDEGSEEEEEEDRRRAEARRVRFSEYRDRGTQ
mmetsp:Transcript_33099/g.67561  ORF Transcript_33099/g.67561 Transcript_33099/m.67561 type:complete len:82 (+) Transcript_33099:465-710(+)